MEYYEEVLSFELEQQQEKSLFDSDFANSKPEPEILGVKVRLGNAPMCFNLERLMQKSNKELPAELQLQFETQKIYLITHAIGVVRFKGNAKVVELQYNAEAKNIIGAKTIDLLPRTTFIDKLKIDTGLSGALKAAGNMSVEIPDELKNALSGTSLSLGGDLELELSTNAKFVGKINYSIQLPVVQSMGVSSNKCTWVLKPDANPLLGDQLLVQTISVPKETENLIFSIKGLIKVDNGWFSKTKEQETSIQTITLKLD